MVMTGGGVAIGQRHIHSTERSLVGLSSVGAHPDTRPSQSQANSGKAGQSWANSGKVGQSWARLGKVGQSRANRNVVTVVWKPRRAFDFCPVIVTSLTGAGKCYLLHTQIRRIMPSAADNHIMPSFSRLSEIYFKWKLQPGTCVFFYIHMLFWTTQTLCKILTENVRQN